MMRVMMRCLAMLTAVGLTWAAASASQAADVVFTMSSRETYVGVPVRIQVIVKDARQHQPPDFPEIQWADVEMQREVASAHPTSASAGFEQSVTTTYTYVVSPRQAGTFMIPPIHVDADGESFSTATMTLTALASDSGDLLYLVLVAERQSVYLGEPIDATLEIWLKPYRTTNVRMDVGDMWQYVVDEDASVWGPFADSLQGLPRNRTETRADAAGRQQDYFVYSLNRRVWPDRPGVFDADGVSIAVNYPLTVRRNRFSRLGRAYEIVESRPISTVVQRSEILVKAPPEADQPAGYRGAVGKYSIATTASPTEVSVGDPIALTLMIRGTGRMDSLQAPSLAKQESLREDFRVPEEDLAGRVNGPSKSFSLTIRPKHDEAREIPPIEFSYFDPQTQRYVVLRSDPISLDVKGSTRLPVSELVNGNDRAGARTELTRVETGLLANYGDVEAMLSQQSLSFGWGIWALAVSGPLLCITCVFVRRHRDDGAADTGLHRRRSARRSSMAALRLAEAEPDRAVAVSQVVAAVTGFIADRRNLPRGGLTRSEAINQLRAADVPEDLIKDVDRLLAECERARFHGREPTDTDVHRRDARTTLVERGRGCVNDLAGRKI